MSKPPESRPEHLKPSQTFRLAGRSVAPIVLAVEAQVSRVGNARKISIRDRKFSTEAFLNAIVLRALALPEEALDALLAEGVADYERVLAGGDLPGAAGQRDKARRKRPG